MKSLAKNFELTDLADVFYIVVINFLLIVVFGFLTLDSFANWNSRFGAFLLSFFIPVFILLRTRQLSRTIRFFRYGFGLIIYSVFAIFIAGFTEALSTFLLPSTILFGSMLYGGDVLLKQQ